MVVLREDKKSDCSAINCCSRFKYHHVSKSIQNLFQSETDNSHVGMEKFAHLYSRGRSRLFGASQLNGAGQLYILQPAQLISLSFPIVFLSFWDKDDVDSGHLDSRGGWCTAVAASPALLAMRRQLRQLQQPQVACKEVVSFSL